MCSEVTAALQVHPRGLYLAVSPGTGTFTVSDAVTQAALDDWGEHACPHPACPRTGSPPRAIGRCTAVSAGLSGRAAALGGTNASPHACGAGSPPATDGARDAIGIACGWVQCGGAWPQQGGLQVFRESAPLAEVRHAYETQHASRP